MDWRLRWMRRPALNIPGDAHALTFTCYRRFPFLRSERICGRLTDTLHEARTRLDFRIWA